MSIYTDILKKNWGYPSFREMQEDIIVSVADDNKDTLGLLPTGGGKSILFQVPALAKDGVCIVVTPLIALMKDQVENLKRRNIKALAVYTGMTRHEIGIALDNIVYGDYKFLYLSPERLGTELFLAKLPSMNINLIAIDESHCISQWGYDFRPSYLKIADIRQYLPNVPILALTATATPEVAIDIQEKLKFKESNLFRKSFERTNLIYIVRKVEDKMRYLLKIAKTNKGTAVVYVRNRKKTREIAKFLQNNGISADYFHAGIDPKEKDRKQDDWKNDKIRIIVSTNAFGMGIDKSDVRFVVHMDLPDTIEAYFQEAGRGGRDEKTAYAVLLYNNMDIVNLKRSITNAYPEREMIKKVYTALGNFLQIPIGAGKGFSYDFNISEFAKRYKLPILQVFSALKFLQREGYLEFTEEIFQSSKLIFNVGQEDLYKFQVANANLDSFIKLILRSYSGVFSDYTNINEFRLSKKANTSKEVIYKYLQNLAKFKIITYIPQRKTPYIIYTEERLEDKSVRISKENYDKLKERQITRIEGVIDYITNKEKCRSQMLLIYFGEKDAKECGNCDYCRRKANLELKQKEFEIIKDEIKKLLKNERFTFKELVDKIDKEEDKVMKVVRELQENKIIIIDDKLKLIWTE